jgi:hypothetical protein
VGAIEDTVDCRLDMIDILKGTRRRAVDLLKSARDAGNLYGRLLLDRYWK